MPWESKAGRNVSSRPSRPACPPVLGGKVRGNIHLDRVQVFLLGNKPTALLKGVRPPVTPTAEVELLQYSAASDLSS